MLEKIVVPLDGSKVGEAALPYARDLMSKLSSEVEREVILLQVLHPEIPQTAAGGEAVVLYTEQELEENKKKALDYLNKVAEASSIKGVRFSVKVAVGDASEEIVKTAEETNASLIAISTHGRSGLSKWAFGSVTDKVLRREGKIPIAVIRAQ